jgi:hypothetical protein
MELAPSILAGLALAADVADFASVVAAAFAAATNQHVNATASALADADAVALLQLDASSPSAATTKQVYAAVVGLVFEACKHNTPASSLATLLGDAGVGGDDAAAFLAAYADKRGVVVDILARTTFSFPSIVGIDWKLDYLVKTDALDGVRAAVYSISRSRDLHAFAKHFHFHPPAHTHAPAHTMHTLTCSSHLTRCSARAHYTFNGRRMQL